MPLYALASVALLSACQPEITTTPAHTPIAQFQIEPRAANAATAERPGGLPEGVGSALMVRERGGEPPTEPLELPLEHTDVKIKVSGFVARAVVTQRYGNPYDQPIEAVYTFPLPNEAAVDAMTMKIGERTIKGEIEKRDEARKLYEEARDRGERASLLEQERPNIFTQAVANILPGDRIEIEIQYVDILDYRDNAYELVFPMVVGPRYITGAATGRSGTGWAPDTDRVPDASRITPPVLTPEQRSGHDIAVAVELDAGLPIQGLHSLSHALDVWERSDSDVRVLLSPADTIVNKDLVLRYEVAGDSPEVALLPHHDERGGFFTLMVQPQRDVTGEETVNRELIFIVDTSGSMRGQPMEAAKAAVKKLIRGMRPGDRFNIVRFAGGTGTLYAMPEEYTEDSARQAIGFVDGFRGSGGTEMAAGIRRALTQPAARGYLRLAFLLTDGFVDEREVFESIQNEKKSARVFTLGVGSSPNRYLLDRSATLGRGEAFYVRQDEDPTEVTDALLARVDRPALTNIEIDWGKLDVRDVYPARIPDLFAGSPLRVHGRYQRGGDGVIVVRGELAGRPYEQELAVSLDTDSDHDTMATVWARQKVKSLMLESPNAQENEAAITQVGLEFRILTQWTSFVALEARVVNVDGKPKTVVQPVELPEGVDHEGVFGRELVNRGGRGGLLNVLGTTGHGRASAGIGGLGIRGGGVGGGVRYGGMVKLGGRRSRNPIGASTSVVMGALPKEVIQRVIDQHKNQVRYCYEVELQRSQDLQGKVMVKFIINATGAVAKVIIVSSTLKAPTVEKCILAKIRTWIFPAPAGGGIVEVNYPFVFRSM